MAVSILTGDCRDILKTLPAESVHCCVCSPPYWGLRSYGVGTENGELGLEPSLADYVAGMVEVFREVRRVLRADGTAWINLGDSYATSVNGRSAADTKAVGNDDRTFRDKPFSTITADWKSRVGQSGNKGNPGADHGFRVSDPILKPKDLCGIPWRVAFALQAPDYLGNIRNETDRAWLAALVDGEGCISILETTSGRESGPVSTSYPPILQVRMCDRECIDKAMSLVGSTSDNPAQYPPSQGGVRPAFQWRIHGRKAADTIAEIYPFLLIKRKQAIVAWNHQAAREGYETKRGVKVPADAVEKQKLCRDLIQKLNQREPVDLPSWMVEPPQPIGPGWYLRQDVIWSKPNPMPESVRDRCTKAHEYLFLLAKSERYFYDADAIKEDCSTDSHGSPNINPGIKNIVREDGGSLGKWTSEDKLTGRNKRSVWEVTTQPFSEAHFATFPPALIEPCILAGCPKECCAKCGAPWVREVERGTPVQQHWAPGTQDKIDKAQGRHGASSVFNTGFISPNVTLGFSPPCACSAGIAPGTVLDPFGGAGTTGLVADRLGRNAILIELNPAYAEMAERRLRNDAGMFAGINQRASQGEYDPIQDVEGSFAEAYRVIRQRMAAGGPGWTPRCDKTDDLFDNDKGG